MNLTAQSLRDEFLGRVCITRQDERCLLNQRIARLSPGPLVEPRFLVYALKASRFRRFVDSLNTGSLIQHMFTRQLDEFEVPVPPREVQLAAIEGVGRDISLLDDVERTIDLALSSSDGLRREILAAAFSGRLVQQDPNDEPASELLARIAADRPGPARSRKKKNGG